MWCQSNLRRQRQQKLIRKSEKIYILKDIYSLPNKFIGENKFGKIFKIFMPSHWSSLSFEVMKNQNCPNEKKEHQ